MEIDLGNEGKGCEYIFCPTIIPNATCVRGTQPNRK